MESVSSYKSECMVTDRKSQNELWAEVPERNMQLLVRTGCELDHLRGVFTQEGSFSLTIIGPAY